MFLQVFINHRMGVTGCQPRPTLTPPVAINREFDANIIYSTITSHSVSVCRYTSL